MTIAELARKWKVSEITVSGILQDALKPSQEQLQIAQERQADHILKCKIQGEQYADK